MKGPRSRGSCLSACAALALISAVLAPHAVASPGAPALRMAAIDRYIESEMRAQQIPGLSLALFRNGVPVYVKGFGVATLEHAVPAQPRTVYQLGSIGKQFTAAAIMLLADEHRLDLDAPLARYLPEAPASWAGVTVRRMLNHQSGIAQLSDASHHLLDLRRDYSDGQLVRLAASQPLEFAPGTDADYSDTAYVLLGIVINRVTHGFYGDFLQDRLFRPLGMRHTRIISDVDIVPDRASGYEITAGGALGNQSWVSPTLNRTADGSLYSTVLDLGLWDAALYGNHVLPQAELARMWTVDPVENGHRPLYHYGYGWEINFLRGHRVIEYDGNWQGFQAAMARYPDHQLTVVVLTNRSLCRTQRLVHGVAGLVDPELVPYAAALRDSDPAATAGFSRLLDSVRDGDASYSWATALARELRAVGPVRQVAFAEQRVSDGARERVYRVELAQMVDYVSVRYTGDGMIADLDLYREF